MSRWAMFMWVLIESLKHKTWWLVVITAAACCLSMKGRRIGTHTRDSTVVETSQGVRAGLER